jgi:hypothetical protein
MNPRPKRWDEDDWAFYRAWTEAWLKKHAHELPSQVKTKNGRWVPLGKKHRWKFANDAWLKARRQLKTARENAALD